MRQERGNVAVAFQIPQTTPEVRPQKKPAPRPKGLPKGEKILYLFSVVVCVCLAAVVVSKYAEITELNVSIQQLDKQIQQAKEVNLQLETEKKKLGSVERIRKFAEENDLVLIPSITP
jgi:cell division protein FtsL